MPVARRKKTKTPEGVPTEGDPERKRVLNVLAQRRYRQRRREKIAALEAQAKSQRPPQRCDKYRDGGIQLIPELTTSSSLESPIEDRDVVEDILRDSDDFGFPMMDFGQDSLDMQLFEGFGIGDLPSSTPSTTSSQSVSSSSTPPPSLNFPMSSDGAQLTVPCLSAIRAFASITAALNISSVIWDPHYMHTLPATPLPNLPINLHPTPAQIAIPHHPILDALPWPSVREKIICILSLPSMCRPPVAQDDEAGGMGQTKAVYRLAHDLDDLQEGARVHGNVVGWHESSELAEEAWEMGECFYRNWWFAVDQKAVDMTNARRKERGLGVLRLEPQRAG